MARPTKQGIDYFPLDCQFDDKTEMLLIEKGAVGLGVIVTLWQMIYSNEGYFIVNNKDLHLLIKRKIDVDVNEVSECINVCISRGLFSESMHDKHGILTSKAIQKRYFDAAKKKKQVIICKDYIINGVSVCENAVNDCENTTNVNVEVKENENVSEIKPEKTKRFSPPTIDQVRKYVQEKGYSVDPEKFVNYYEASGWMRNNTKIKSWQACVRTWVSRDGNETKQKTRKML